MKILIRLPNWLGDMVMSIYFVQEVKRAYPQAEISVIVKKGLESLLQFFPSPEHTFIFSKNEYKGITGNYKFGKSVIRSATRFDLFFCLPDSLSSAFMGWAASAKKRIGYAKEGRSVLLTNSYLRNREVHRVIQYLQLLEKFSGASINYDPYLQLVSSQNKREGIIVNIHSEAISRRLPVEKARSIIELLCSKTNVPITMIGGLNDKVYTDEVIGGLTQPARVINKAGATSLPQLVEIFSKASVMLSSDSGPAHLANASGLPTIVLFGAGDEKETGPYYKAAGKVIRLGKLPCEPCVSNTCIFGKPVCLIDLDNEHIVNTVLQVASEPE